MGFLRVHGLSGEKLRDEAYEGEDSVRLVRQGGKIGTSDTARSLEHNNCDIE